MNNPMWSLTSILSTLWQGKYSLAKSFWVFFCIGSLCIIPVAILARIPFILLEARQPAILVFLLIFWGYEIIASVGVWRSANAVIGRRVFHGNTVTISDGAKIFGAKTFVVVWMLGNILRVTGPIDKFVASLLHNL